MNSFHGDPSLNIYIALSPEIFDEIQLAKHMPALESAATVQRWEGPGNPPPGVLAAAMQQNEVIITGWGTPSMIEMLTGWQPQISPLRLVAHTAGSVKFLLTADALERGLLVTTANDSLAEAVAEWTIGAFLAMRRKIITSAMRFHAGQPPLGWDTMRELPGSVIGIIGASAIGRRVMDLLRPWNVQILLFDPYFSPQLAAQYSAKLVSLEDLMRQSDIVSLHAPVTPETIGMLRGEHFAMMKDGALFVNTARGRLVEMPGLLAELQRGRIDALLDVTDPQEPLPPESPFFRLPNCVVLPHIAGMSAEARARQGAMTAEDILRFAAGQPLLRQVTLAKWATMA